MKNTYILYTHIQSVAGPLKLMEVEGKHVLTSSYSKANNKVCANPHTHTHTHTQISSSIRSPPNYPPINYHYNIGSLIHRASTFKHHS